MLIKDKNYSTEGIANLIYNKSKYFKVKLEKNKVFALIDERVNLLNKKVDKNYSVLRDVVLVGKGMETAANEVFSFKEYPSQFSQEFIKKRIGGGIISRYFIGKEKEYLLYFENIKSFDKLPKNIKEHLVENKKILENRATVKNEGRIWWKYSRPMHKEYYNLNKLWCSYRSKENAFVYDDTKDFIGLTNTTVIFDTNNKISLKYLLALLNSKLLNFRYKSLGKQTGSGVFEYFENGIGKLPIPEISIGNQNVFIVLINQMLKTQKLLYNCNTETDKKVNEQKIILIDRQIDKLVYKLYELTENEIQIIEDACK